MTAERQLPYGARSFLTCATEVAGLLGIEGPAPGPATVPVPDPASVPKEERRRARRLAGAARKPLLARAALPEEFFEPLMAAAVYDPDPSFCLWFVEPAVYAFGRRRVLMALVAYLREGTDAERMGAMRAWYSAGVPLRADRSPAYAPDGVRDPALDVSRAAVVAWRETVLTLLATTTDQRLRHRLMYEVPQTWESCPPHLHALLDGALEIARAHPTPSLRQWATAMDRDRPPQ